MSEENKNFLETIDIELSDEEFLRLAKLAHEHDVTFNQLVNGLLRAHIEELKVKTNEN